MSHIVLDAQAGEASAELARRGIASDARVHVVVDIIEASGLPMAAIAQVGAPLTG